MARQRDSTTVAKTPWGSALRVNSSETIGQSISDMGVYDLVLSEAIWRLTKSGMSTADIGANIGYFSSLLSQRVGSAGSVASFEPHPQLFARLQENIRPHVNCSLYPLALSDKNRAGELFVPANFDGNEGTASLEKNNQTKVIPVEVRALDELLPGKKIDLIKIDVEGHELSVFQGAKKILATTSYVLLEDFEGTKSPAIAYLKELGFEVFRLKKDFFGPKLLSVQEGEKLPLWEPPNYLATRSTFEAHRILAPRGWRCLGR